MELLHRDVLLLNRGAQSLVLVLLPRSNCCRRGGPNRLVSGAKSGRATSPQTGGGGGGGTRAAAAHSLRLEAFSGGLLLGGPGEDPLAAVVPLKQLVQTVPELLLAGAWLRVGGL